MKHVIIIIHNLYDLGIWKIIFLRYRSSLGNFKILTDGCIAAGDPDRNGSRRTDVDCISVVDRDRDHRSCYIEVLNWQNGCMNK